MDSDISDEEFARKMMALLKGELDDSPLSMLFLLEGVVVMAEELDAQKEKIRAKLLAVMVEKFKKLQYENCVLIDRLTSAEVAHDTITHDLRKEIEELTKKYNDLKFRMDGLEK